MSHRPNIARWCVLLLLSSAAFADEIKSSAAGNVNEHRVIAEVHTGNNWPVNGGDFGAQHFSPLREISSQNVATLGLAWTTDIPSPNGLATEPIVVDGIIYLSASLDRISAIDATSGKVRWTYDPKVRLSFNRNSLTARTNRGVAVWEGKVFFGTGDCRMIALDAATGKPVWEASACLDSTITGITGAPRVGGGRVYIGTNGSDSSVGGSVSAFDAATGKQVWRIATTPGDPAKGYENRSLEMASKTWAGDRWWLAGGAAVWDAMTYDPDSGLLLLATAGPGDGPDRAIKSTGDRLFSGCILAVRADTGAYVWHYQTARHATAVSPENFHVLITSLFIRGKMRHVAMTVPRFGEFFIFDAKTGELLSRKSLGSRPASQQSPPTPEGKARNAAGHNWWPMSYSPLTGLVYVPGYDDVSGAEGYLTEAVGTLIAWDPIKQSARWTQRVRFPTNGGVLSTAGNLVFFGDGAGIFSAFAADTGRALWSIDTLSSIESIPVTYAVNGTQYVLMPIGLGGMSRNFNATSVMATPESKRGAPRLLVFRLGASKELPYPKPTLAVVPKPPVQTESAQVIDKGRRLYVEYTCENCHSPQADAGGAWELNGAIPDLRYMPADVHNEFYAIVMAGSHRNNGMPGFADGIPNWPIVSAKMSVDDAKAIHAYLVQLQWQAYDADRARLNQRTAPAGRKP